MRQCGGRRNKSFRSECTSTKTLFSDNALRRELHMQIEEDLKNNLMADFPEEWIEDFIETLMEDSDGGFDSKLILVLTEHEIQKLVEDLI